MSIYDTSQLYGLAQKAADEYTRFFACIAVAVKATRFDNPCDTAKALSELNESCDSFSDLLLEVRIICNEHTKTQEQ